MRRKKYTSRVGYIIICRIRIFEWTAVSTFQFIYTYIYIYIYVYQLAKRHCGGCSHGVQSGVAPVLLLAARLLLSPLSLKHVCYPYNFSLKLGMLAIGSESNSCKYISVHIYIYIYIHMSISWPCETMGVAPTVCNLGLLQFCCLLPGLWWVLSVWSTVSTS